MSDKKYVERPKSYRIIAKSREEMNEAIKEIIKDHPEVAKKDERGEEYCAILKNKYGFYVLKNP
jgi:CDP-diacylglycerol pyrophosphatase